MTSPTKLQSFRTFTRKVLALALPYFNSDEKWKARGPACCHPAHLRE